MARKKKVKKRGKGRKAALILSIIAIIFLVFQSIYYLATKEIILAQIKEALHEFSLPEGITIETIAGTIFNVIFIFSIVWLILAALIIWTTYLLERGKGKWYAMLICGIISLLTLRFDAGILSIISSVLYKKQK